MKKLIALTLAVMSVPVIMLGCSPAKKPTPAPNQITQNRPQTDIETNRMPSKPNEVTNLANKLAKVAGQEKGVKKATVVLTGTNAYVGIDLVSNMEAAETNRIKKAVANRVKNADKRLTDVYVTSDVGVVTRIRKVAEGLAAGKPVSTFVDEIAEIGRRIKPQK